MTTGDMPRPMRSIRLLAAAMVLAIVVAQPGAAITTFNDTLVIVQPDETPTTGEVSVRLAQHTFSGSVETVLIGRDDVFADALASGLLQGRGAPLLLVPSDGPLPGPIRAQLARLDPGRVVLLGGPAAVSTAVEEELRLLGFTVQRRSGGSRVETAVDIAVHDAPTADTVLLLRAFPVPGDADATQAFADALAAGAWSAATGWPVLLSQRDALSDATRDHLVAAPVQRVILLGGEAALTATVEDAVRDLGVAVERVAGATRSHTAVAIAARRGATTAADATRITVVEGQADTAWAGGFAAAAHSAILDAPIVLSNGPELPPVTRDWLAGAVPPATIDEPILTCITSFEACAQARVALGLPHAAAITFDPPEGTSVVGSQVVMATISPTPPPAAVTVGGSCVADPGPREPAADGSVQITLADAAPSSGCQVAVAVSLGNGSVQTEAISYRLSANLATDAVAPADFFGSAVALDGDTIAVGAPSADVAESNAGAVHLFTGTPDTGWVPHAVITPAEVGAGDAFGRSVALQGDVLVVGSLGGDSDSGFGTAHVFRRTTGGSWIEEAELRAPDGRGSLFAGSVAVSSEVVVVGDPHDDHAGPSSGAVHVFARDAAGAWFLQATLLASDAAEGDQFGGAVAVDDDTILVGSPGRTGGDGAVYALSRDADDRWGQEATLAVGEGATVATRPRPGFGYSVALDGDTALIGGPFDADDFGVDHQNRGAAYVFERSAGVWVRGATLIASNGAAGEFAGLSVALGEGTAVVGAPATDGQQAGRAYVFMGSTDGWAQGPTLTGEQPGGEDGFGRAVAVDGRTAVVGAPLDDGRGVNSGAAYAMTVS